MIDIIIKIIQMNIITNAVAGIILFIVLKKFFDWLNERRQERIVNTANQNVMELLRPYIISGQFPARETFLAIISSTARTHQIHPQDLYSVKYFCQEFIKEILANSYVSQEEKVSYTDMLKVKIASYDATPSIWAPDTVEEPFEEKKRTGRFNNQLNICTFVSSAIIMIVNLASGANDIYASLGIFAVVLFVLFLISDFGIKRGHYKDIPRVFNLLKKKSKRFKEEHDRKQEERRSQRLATENKILADERDKLKVENNNLKVQLELIQYQHPPIPISPLDVPVSQPPITETNQPVPEPTETKAAVPPFISKEALDHTSDMTPPKTPNQNVNQETEEHSPQPQNPSEVA